MLVGGVKSVQVCVSTHIFKNMYVKESVSFVWFYML